MEVLDLLIAPIYLLLFYSIAYILRSKYTNAKTKKYFIPALTLKFIGAISLGLVYQFVYGIGDTFSYHKYGKILNQSFLEAPLTYINIMITSQDFGPDTFKYIGLIPWYKSPSEFLLVKITSIFSLISFGNYSVIALFFAAASFTGLWALYTTLVRIKPELTKEMAIAIFFLPSVFFWGSGLMKDSITIGALGWLFHGFYFLFIKKQKITISIIIILISAYLIGIIKVYILLSFLPPALFWVFLENNNKIKNKAIRIIAKPIFIGLGLIFSYFGATNITKGDSRYDVETIGERAKITQEYLSKQVSSGSSYDIGILDGTISGTLKLAPQAIVVSLYRPFLWEVRNSIMLISAIEGAYILFLTISLFYKIGIIKALKSIFSTPILMFCFTFVIIFAIGVGISSGNFGTLVRYKIPLIPFYLAGLFIMKNQNIKNLAANKINRFKKVNLGVHP